jgi:hypothetical protein
VVYPLATCHAESEATEGLRLIKVERRRQTR